MNKWVMKLTSNQSFESWKSFLELLSYLITIIGIVAIIVTCIQYFREKNNRKEDSEYRKAELAVQILKQFSEEIIPSMNNFYKRVDKEFEDVDLEKLIKEDKEKYKEILTAVKLNCQIIDIFNALEQISAYIRKDIVDQEILFDPISNVTIRFVEQNEDVFERITKNSPYANLQYVLTNWTQTKRIQFLNERKKEVEDQIKDIEKNQKS